MGITIACKTSLANNTKKLTVSVNIKLKEYPKSMKYQGGRLMWNLRTSSLPSVIKFTAYGSYLDISSKNYIHFAK